MSRPINLTISLNKKLINSFLEVFGKHTLVSLGIFLSLVSILSFIFFYLNGLGLSYNDARSHLDIGRRVVEGLKPGLAQLGSVWLPLPHILMLPFIWNNFMWHSGLAGALESMVSYVATGLVIYLFLKTLNVTMLGRIVGVLIFALNLNILYLQSTAMTELLLISTSILAVYYILLWHKNSQNINLINSAFWVMLATLNRYDGWFLLFYLTILIIFQCLKKFGYKVAEGTLTFFLTLGGFGIVMWFVWNQLIFKDALYFVFGPYSAHTQQSQLAAAGNLVTQGNLLFSIKTYFYALFYDTGTLISILGFIGVILLWFDKNIKPELKVATSALFAPLLFNILALYLGFSVLFIQGISGNTWFNVRYGVLMIPSIAIFVGYLVDKATSLKWVLIGLLLFVMIFTYTSFDAATIDDARVGSSQKNVSEVSGWLNQHAKNEKGFILISAASHDAIIFSSGISMNRFIHEGTGAYWDNATKEPDRWARWIVMRTYDNNDSTYRLTKSTPGISKYTLVENFPFASVYQLQDQYLNDLNTEPINTTKKISTINLLHSINPATQLPKIWQGSVSNIKSNLSNLKL